MTKRNPTLPVALILMLAGAPVLGGCTALVVGGAAGGAAGYVAGKVSSDDGERKK